MFVLEQLIVVHIEGLAYISENISTATDFHMVFTYPLLLFTLDDVFHYEFPIIISRVIPLLGRSQFARSICAGFLSSSFSSSSLKLLGSSSSSSSKNNTKNKNNDLEIAILGKRKSHAPSDVPSIRLAQLMRRALDGRRNIKYDSSELTELKELLLLVCHHKLYSHVELAKTHHSKTKEQHEEFQQMQNAWVLEKWQSKRQGKRGKRQSAGDAAFGRGSISLQNIRSHGHEPRDQRINTAPDRSSVIGLNQKLATNQFKIDSFLIEKMEDWDFDVFLFDKVSMRKPLTSICAYMFSDSRYDWETLLNTKELQWTNYVSEVEKTYGHNIYHTNLHATDVVQSAHFMVHMAGLSSKLSELEVFSLMLAALIHDFKHPGLNNSFLVKTGHELAILHNDVSCLENHHVSSAFMLMKQEKLNPLKNLNKLDTAKVRELAITLVLATDLKHHFDIVADFKSELASLSISNSSAVGTDEKKHTTTIINTLNQRNDDDEQMGMLAMKFCIKVSDIGHPTKSKPIHLAWSRLIMREFYAQGDEEKKRNFSSITPLCDREDSKTIPQSQKGFIR